MQQTDFVDIASLAVDSATCHDKQFGWIFLHSYYNRLVFIYLEQKSFYSSANWMPELIQQHQKCAASPALQDRELITQV